MTHRI